MNNGKIAVDNIDLSMGKQVDRSPMLRMRETEITEIIVALQNINSSVYWKTISKVFDGALDILQRKLENEKEDKELYRLQGRISERKSLNLSNLVEVYKKELANIKEQLKKYG